jgi:hypothetical protein
LEPPGHEEERKTKEDLEVSYGRGMREGRTWREVKRLAADRSRWKSFVEALLLLHRRQQEIMMMMIC